MPTRVILALAGILVLVAVGGLTFPSHPATATGTAVLDRFEGEHAVLVFDDARDSDECCSSRSHRTGGRVIDRRTVVVERTELPPAGRRPDAVFEVRLVGRTVVSARYDRPATRERAARTRARFERLAAERPPPASAEPPASSELRAAPQRMGFTCGECVSNHDEPTRKANLQHRAEAHPRDVRGRLDGRIRDAER